LHSGGKYKIVKIGKGKKEKEGILCETCQRNKRNIELVTRTSEDENNNHVYQISISQLNINVTEELEEKKITWWCKIRTLNEILKPNHLKLGKMTTLKIVATNNTTTTATKTKHKIPKTRTMRIKEETWKKLYEHSQCYYNVESYDTIILNLLECYDKSHYQKWFLT
jgi:hypothetical protein